MAPTFTITIRQYKWRFEFTCGDIVIRFILGLLYMGIAYLIYFALRKVYREKDSSCVQGHEVSGGFERFILFCPVAIVPNIWLAFVGQVCYKLYKSPFCVMYNLLMGVLYLQTGFQLIYSLTCCKSESQNAMYDGSVVLIGAASAHLGMCLATVFMVDERDTWSRQVTPIVD